MKIKEAVSLFIGSGGRPRLNCGQAVAEVFKEKFSLSKEFIAGFASSGFGKAPEGVCGALYAVQEILRRTGNNEIQEITDSFSSHAGSTHCADIRRLKKVSCIGCVKKAASILNTVTYPKTDE